MEECFHAQMSVAMTERLSSYAVQGSDARLPREVGLRSGIQVEAASRKFVSEPRRSCRPSTNASTTWRRPCDWRRRCRSSSGGSAKWSG